MRYLTDNCKKADHLAAEAARLMGATINTARKEAGTIDGNGDGIIR